MAQYIVRVELHGATSEKAYESLHEAMANQGFSRTIRADDGNDYYLPTAMYSVSGEFSTGKVADAANDAADSTGYNSTILAVNSNGWSGRGLQKVKTSHSYR